MNKKQKPYGARPENAAEAVMEWIQFHSREVMWGIVTVAVVAGGFWFYRLQQATQARNAAAALNQAEQSVANQNLPLAKSQLEAMIKRYPATSSGKVGMYILAQVHYQVGEYQQGIDALKPLTDGDDPYFTAGALSLVAGGYEQLKKYPEAAAAFQKAAASYKYESEKAVALASAARDLLLAGKVDDAKAIYRQLAADPEGFGAAEARVRLGEMEAKPAS